MPESQKRKSNEYVLRLYNLYIGGLMALILVVLQAFLGLGSADVPIAISVTAFAAALPLLGGVLVVNLVEEKYPYGKVHSISARFMNVFFVGGAVATLVGMVAAFWHLLWEAGLTFLIALLVSTIIYGWYISELDEKSGETTHAEGEKCELVSTIEDPQKS